MPIGSACGAATFVSTFLEGLVVRVGKGARAGGATLRDAAVLVLGCFVAGLVLVAPPSARGSAGPALLFLMYACYCLAVLLADLYHRCARLAGGVNRSHSPGTRGAPFPPCRSPRARVLLRSALSRSRRLVGVETESRMSPSPLAPPLVPPMPGSHRSSLGAEENALEGQPLCGLDAQQQEGQQGPQEGCHSALCFLRRSAELPFLLLRRATIPLVAPDQFRPRWLAPSLALCPVWLLFCLRQRHVPWAARAALLGACKSTLLRTKP